MPDKKFGVFEMLKGVFKIKKPPAEDIVYQAERIISEYVSQKRTETVSRCLKKRHIAKNIVITFLFAFALFCFYRIIR